MRVNSWFNAKRVKFGSMGFAWVISPRTKFMMMITIVNNAGPNYTSSFSSGTILFPHIFFISQLIFQEACQATSSDFCGVTARSRQLKSLPFSFTGPPQ